MKLPTLLSRGAASLALVFAAACASVNPIDLNRDELAAADKSLASGEAKAAAKRAENLYAARAAEADEYVLQRFFALYLTTQAHVRAAQTQSFLGSDAGASSVGSARCTDVPHLVAALYYSSLARELAPKAAKAKPVVEGARQLPPALEEIGVDVAGQRLGLARLVAYARLGFLASIGTELDAWPELRGPEGADSVLAVAKPERELVPWVYYALFTHARLSSDTDAYMFGARARLLAEATKNSIPPERLAEVVAWVQQKKDADRVVFACSKCRKPFLGDKLRCLDDGTPITDFFLSSLD